MLNFLCRGIDPTPGWQGLQGGQRLTRVSRRPTRIDSYQPTSTRRPVQRGCPRAVWPTLTTLARACFRTIWNVVEQELQPWACRADVARPIDCPHAPASGNGPIQRGWLIPEINERAVCLRQRSRTVGGARNRGGSIDPSSIRPSILHLHSICYAAGVSH